jgi:circadian clock protein KaiC
MRLLSMHGLVREFKPAAIVIDPVSNLVAAGTENETKAMLTRLVDYLKNAGVTALFTSLTPGAEPLQETEVAISSLIDTWILLRDLESGGARQRSLAIVKSRGMAHSNEMREFQIAEDGIWIRDRWSPRQGGAADRPGRGAGAKERT